MPEVREHQLFCDYYTRLVSGAIRNLPGALQFASASSPLSDSVLFSPPYQKGAAS